MRTKQDQTKELSCTTLNGVVIEETVKTIQRKG